MPKKKSQASNMLKNFMVKLKRKIELEMMLTDTNKGIFKDSQELYDQMVEEEFDSLELQGVKFTPKEEPNFKKIGIPEGVNIVEIKAFDKWLKEYKYQDIVKTMRSIHHQTLLALLKTHHIEQGKPLPSCLQMEITPMIKYSKVAIERLISNENKSDL